MAATKSSNVRLESSTESIKKPHRIVINDKVESILQSKKNANEIFDLLEYLQVMSRQNTGLT